MSLFESLLNRANSQCELCPHPEGLSLYEIPPSTKPDENTSIRNTSKGK